MDYFSLKCLEAFTLTEEKKSEVVEQPEYTIKFISSAGGDVKNIHLSAQTLKQIGRAHV